MLKLTALTTPAPRGEVDEARRIGRRHPERLLAHDVSSGFEDLARLRHVEMVGRRDVDHLDRRVVENGLERGIGAVDAQRPGAFLAPFRRAAQDSAHLHADPPQLFDVDSPDEARPDDGRADVGDPPHTPTCSLRRERLDNRAGSISGDDPNGRRNAGPCSATARTSFAAHPNFPLSSAQVPGRAAARGIERGRGSSPRPDDSPGRCRTAGIPGEVRRYQAPTRTSVPGGTRLTATHGTSILRPFPTGTRAAAAIPRAPPHVRPQSTRR